MSRKVLFFDIDGTLVESRLGIVDIPQTVKDEMKRLQGLGHKLFISSGRPRAMLNQEILEAGFDGYILANGAYVEIDGQSIYEDRMDATLAVKTMEMLEKLDCSYMIETAKHVYIDNQNNDLYDFFDKVGFASQFKTEFDKYDVIQRTLKIEANVTDENREKVIDYIKNTAEFVRTEEGLVSASVMLERFLFEPSQQYSKIEKLSGGEKRRLNLLRVLMEAPNVLILDEPTNDLDIETMTILEDYLDSFDGIVITVSHDRYFLDRVVRRIFSFEENGVIDQYEGGYTDYINRKKEKGLLEENALLKTKSSSAGKSDSDKTEKEEYKIRNKKLKFSYNEQREYETIEDDIAKLEEKIEKLDGEIVKNATNSVKLRELMESKEETETLLMEKMDRWEYLEDLAKKIEEQ